MSKSFKSFACHENFENQHSEKLIKTSEICKENICGGVIIMSNHFFTVHSNFTFLKLMIYETFIASIVSVFGVILVRIFPHSG